MTRQDLHTDFTDLSSGKGGMHHDNRPATDSVQEWDTAREIVDNPSASATDSLTEPDAHKFRIKELLDGTVLIRENMTRQLPFLLFLTFLGIIYIGNRFHAEKMVREITELKTEVANLRSEQITTTSELMNISRPSEVAALVRSRNLGLKESLEPPKKLRRR
jgi:hypothetical protein